jgi:hypothetical protein
MIGGETHYGWVRLKVGKLTTFSAVVTGYAYETVANKAILAGKTHSTPAKSAANAVPMPAPVPQPATLGLLARGADGMAIWRREEELTLS